MPLLTIPIDALAGPLLLRQHGGADDFGVFIQHGGGRLPVGRIMSVQRAIGSDRGGWFWMITGPAAPESGVALSGDAGSLADARAVFRVAFDRLLGWPASTPSAALPWNVGAERVSGS